MSGDSNLAWDMLTPQQWTTLVTAALAKGDLKAIPGILALCAVHGHPEHAEVWKVEEVMDAIEGSDPTTWERLRDASRRVRRRHDRHPTDRSGLRVPGAGSQRVPVMERHSRPNRSASDEYQPVVRNLVRHMRRGNRRDAQLGGLSGTG